MKKIIVIGAGPAGIFAAINASTCGDEVILIDRNDRIGKKLFITGKGRCNITNASELSDFFDQIYTNPSFLYSALYSYTNLDLLEFFETRGLQTKVERGGRVFPLSDKSSDVISTLYNELKKTNVNLMLSTFVKSIKIEGEGFIVNTESGKLRCDRLVLATGGMSYPKTGSDGSGYGLARALGHTIIKPVGSLVPIVTEDAWSHKLAGVSLKNVMLTLYGENGVKYSEFGEMLFSHYGITGPIALTLSKYILPDRVNELTLDLKPALSYEQLDARVLRDFDKYRNKTISNGLKELTIGALIAPILELSDISPDKPINQISKAERQRLINCFKSLEMRAIGLRPISEAIVTSGGINVLEINPSTMESTIVPRLYFAGELIDVDAKTGGYNLQIAFSTGYLAGTNARKDE